MGGAGTSGLRGTQDVAQRFQVPRNRARREPESYRYETMRMVGNTAARLTWWKAADSSVRCTDQGRGLWPWAVASVGWSRSAVLLESSHTSARSATATRITLGYRGTDIPT